MQKANDRAKVGWKLKADKEQERLAKLHLGDTVRGRDPKTNEWSLKGELIRGRGGKDTK